MEDTLSVRIAAAMRQAEKDEVDKVELGGILMELEDEATTRRQFLGISLAYFELDLYDKMERACDKALETQGNKSCEFIAYHLKGCALRFQGDALYDEGQLETARYVYSHSVRCLEKAIHKDAGNQFVFGSLSNAAHVNFRLGNYEHTLVCITLFVRYKKKNDQEIPESVIEDLADLRTRARNELRIQRGFDNEGSN